MHPLIGFQAQWAVLQKPDCSKAIRSKLNRNLGMLHAAEGNFHDALRYFSDDIYYSSDEFGTDSIQTAGGFFHMATVFHKQVRRGAKRVGYDSIPGHRVVLFSFFHAAVPKRNGGVFVLGSD